jgi:sodium/proline symporter
MGIPEITTFCIYLMGMLFLGLIFYRATNNLPDYILGGRRLGGMVAALSAGASDMSGWLLLGLPGAVYASGMNQVWIAIGLTLGAFLNWQFVAARLRNYTEATDNSITLPDYLENRFEDQSKILRIISAAVILLFFTFYTSSGLVSGAILFEKSFGLDYSTALVIGSLVIVTYTFLGGFLAVSWTDFFQGTLMFLALIVVPVVALNKIGGWDKALIKISAINSEYVQIYSEMTVLTVISLMAWGLGYFGQPHILARFMAVKSHKEIPKARLIGMSWMIVSLYGAIFTGFIGIAYYADNPLVNPETVFIGLSHVLFNPWISGCLIAAILSAIMSTVDSQILVCSSAVTEDFYRGIFRRDASQRELVWISRFSVIVIAILALIIARNPGSRVLELVAYAWAGFGAAFGPVVILSLFWKRMTRNGALGGIITGAITVVIWKQLHGGIFDIYEILPGFILCLLGIVAISLMDKLPSATITKRFDSIG